MSYTPNNIFVYMSAYAGALGGMGASDRILIFTDPANYSGLAMLAGAFAQQLDTLWGGASVTQLDADTIEALSEGVWLERATLVTVQTTRPTFYTQIASAIIAAVQAGDSYVTGQGITPPAPGGGGGSGLPAAPTIDGKYDLLITGGGTTALWDPTNFAPTLAIAGGGSGPFVLGATWTPTGFNFTPAANSPIVTAATLRDNQGHGPTNVFGVANPVPPLVVSYTLNVAGAVTVTGHESDGIDSLDTNAVAVNWASRTFSGVGPAGATSATTTLGNTNATLQGGGATGTVLTGTGSAIVNPSGQLLGTFNPAAQKIYDLCVHTASPHTYTDQNNQPVTMGVGGNGLPITFNFTNENGIAASFDLYESTNLVTGTFTVTRH